MTKERSRSLLALAGFGLDTAGAAWCGARSSRKASRDSWYRDLDKPGFTPPDAVFPVVRTSLYPLIARSEWRIWSAAPSRERYAALRRWISQLVANPQWSKLCFGERRPTLALADVLALAGMIGPYAAGARKVDGAAAYAFIPYGASGCIRHSSAPRNRAAQSSGRLMRDLTRTEVVSSLPVGQRLGECFSQRLPASPW
jgi:tryptophan-rich sensory protein